MNFSKSTTQSRRVIRHSAEPSFLRLDCVFPPQTKLAMGEVGKNPFSESCILEKSDLHIQQPLAATLRNNKIMKKFQFVHLRLAAG
jgi:hypothetical protein